MERKPNLFGSLQEFQSLSEREQIEVRIAWLERKVVEILWAFVSLGSVLATCMVTWMISQLAGNRSLWLLVPVFLVTFVVTAWWGERRAFRGAPPVINP